VFVHLLTPRAGDCDESNAILDDYYSRAWLPEDKAQVLRLRSRNHWMRNRFADASRDTLMALHFLGVEVNGSPSKREVDVLFDQVKNEILAVGFEEILSIPRTRDPRIDLAVDLLNEAGKSYLPVVATLSSIQRQVLMHTGALGMDSLILLV
jgi:hypothetical protein